MGTAWLHSGLGAGARLITVEHDEELARRTADAFADDDRVTVDDLRLFYLTHPALDATEVLTTPASSAVVAARRLQGPADH
ncbi:hypothetical protein ABZT04_07445 [Streptomyces sp. NPDC005492]|uniref:hypothetical protein n=1 Tax=Streptomyces sp. NPDC005492 TaxID=3156883 RepID=UPI0033BA4A68